MLPKFIKKSIFDKMNDGLFNFVWLKIFQLAKEGGGRARISFWQLLTFPKTNLPFWTISVTVVGRTTPVIITYQLDLQLRRAPSKIHVSNFFKWANPGLFLIYFCLFKQTLQILHQIGMWKNDHPVYGARIRTHNLWDLSLLP